MSNPFAAQIVGVEPEPIDPWTASRQLFQQSLPIPDGVPDAQLVAWFTDVHVPQLIAARLQITAVSAPRRKVEPILEDPQHFTHPARASWVSQYAALCDAEQVPIELALVEIHHLHKIWLHFIPYQRKAHGLDQLVGVKAAVKHLGRELAFIAKGPLQDASPLPSGYEPPPGCFARLPPNLLHTIDQVPF
jgi:hypothetical protein